MSAPDMEKVIKGLEHCLRESASVDDNPCDGCPYVGVKECAKKSKEDAISLLKEQDERIKLLEHQLETLTKWRMNAGAFD